MMMSPNQGMMSPNQGFSLGVQRADQHTEPSYQFISCLCRDGC